MAITKIHAIKATLHKAIEYIENPQKTNGQLLLSGYNTEPQMASLEFEMTATLANKAHRSKNTKSKNLAYHMIQSFAPDDAITPEQAHELGRRLAAEFTEGKYEFVIATHVDKDCIHNHIIINAVSFYDYKKLRTVPYRTARRIRGISDRLCAEAEISVLEEPQQLGRGYSDYLKKRKTVPMRTEVRRRLNFVLERATTYQQFKDMAAALGVTVNDRGKHITYLFEGAKKPVRGNKLADTEKYLPDGIDEQLAENADNISQLKKAVKETALQADSLDAFYAMLKQRGIEVKHNKRTEAVTYILHNADDAKVPEDALGKAMSRERIAAAIKQKKFPAPDVAEAETDNIRERYNENRYMAVIAPDTLVELSREQIIRTSKDGLLIAIKDRNGNNGQLMIDAEHIENGTGGQISIAVGSAFEYDIVYSDGKHGMLRGGELIKQVELANMVRPEQISLAANEIKSMSLKGITVTMPKAGIDRAFIPAEFVHYDKLAGTCTVDVYKNWDYGIVQADKDGKESRKNVKGALLADMMIANREPQAGDGLQRRIAYVERKARLVNAKHLASTLLTMSKGRMTTAQDFAPELRKVRKEIQVIIEKIREGQNKNRQYALAARCLCTCQCYKDAWQGYTTTPDPLKPLYQHKHQAELEAYKAAAAQLERLGVNTDVNPVKVQQLVKDRERQLQADMGRLDELKQNEMNLLEQQQTVRELQKTKTDKEAEHDVEL